MQLDLQQCLWKRMGVHKFKLRSRRSDIMVTTYSSSIKKSSHLTYVVFQLETGTGLESGYASGENCVMPYELL